MFLLRIPFLWVEGMALFPLVVVRSKHPNAILLNHEHIHLRQQIELGIIPFYLWYVIEYLIRLGQYGSHYRAYSNICFEREAFENEQDVTYLKNRRMFSFRKYLV